MILGKEVFSFPVQYLTLLRYIYQGYQQVRGILTKNGCKNKSLFSRLEENSQSLVTAVLLPVAKRESDTRFSTSGFFHESVSPRPPSIPLEPFLIFSKIRGDIRE